MIVTNDNRTMSYHGNQSGHQYNLFSGSTSQQRQQQQQQQQQYTNLFFGNGNGNGNGTGGNGNSSSDGGAGGGGGSANGSSYHDPLHFADYMTTVADDLAQSLYYASPSAAAAAAHASPATNQPQYSLMPTVDAQGHVYYTGGLDSTNAGHQSSSNTGYNVNGAAYHVQMPPHTTTHHPQQHYYSTGGMSNGGSNQQRSQSHYASGLVQPHVLGNNSFYDHALSNGGGTGSSYSTSTSRQAQNLEQSLLYNNDLLHLAASVAPAAATEYLLSHTDLDPTPVSNSTTSKPGSSNYSFSHILPRPASVSNPYTTSSKEVVSLDNLTSLSTQPEDVASLPLKSKTSSDATANGGSVAKPDPPLSQPQKTGVRANMSSHGLPQSIAEETMRIPDLSAEPLTGAKVCETIEQRANDVTKRYLPCVDFLVSCQQDLRRGVEKHKRSTGRHKMSSSQFFKIYLEPLPSKFFSKYKKLMPHQHLIKAAEEVSKLCGDSKQVERAGPEQMKSTFLGGMREGQSWGLRRWLSKNGAALQACNEFEMILTALQKLDESSEFCIALATKIRKITYATRERLLSDIPKAYQEFSSAHPFLPFFHRLDAALKNLSEFDPEDDDVILMDDDEIEEMKAKAKAKDAEKAKEASTSAAATTTNLNVDSVTATSASASATSLDKQEAVLDRTSEDRPSSKRSLDTETDDESYSFQNQFLSSKRPRMEVLSENDVETHQQSNNNSNNTKQGDDDSIIEIIDIDDDEGPEPDSNEQEPQKEPQQKPDTTELHPPAKASTAAEPERHSPSPSLLLEQLGGENFVLGSKDDWRCSYCVFKNPANSTICSMCDQYRTDIPNDNQVATSASAPPQQREEVVDQYWDFVQNEAISGRSIGHEKIDSNNSRTNSNESDDDDDEEEDDDDEDDDDSSETSTNLGQVGQVMAQTVERFRHSPNFGTPTVDFWDKNWSFCVNLFAKILRQKESIWYLEPVNEEELEQLGRPPYRSIIKNPLSFKCIIRALKRSERSKSDSDGMLRGTNLRFNVRHGRDLLQAIDVVFLNALAYNGKEMNEVRRDTLKLRRMFWDSIRKQTEHDPSQAPTRRGETSGFIVK